jgi:hypothetical protein
MAVAEQDQATESSEGGARHAALKAAAIGAATFVVRASVHRGVQPSQLSLANEGWRYSMSVEDEGQSGDEGLSTSKKVVAGVALGVAVPAAVGVAKKLLGDDDPESGGSDGSESRAQSARSGGTRSSGRRKTTAARKTTSRRKTGAARKTGGARKTAARKTSGARKTASRKTAGARKTASRKTAGARKTAARKTAGARKTTARKTSARKTAARRSGARKTAARRRTR